jgi:hypothetical protein
VDTNKATLPTSGQPPSGTAKPERPRWVQIIVFTTLLFALTLLAMWGSSR